VSNGGLNAKLGQVAIVVEGTVAAVSHYMTRESAHPLSVAPQQLLQEVLVGRGAGGDHRRRDNSGRMIVYCDVGLVGEMQSKRGVVNDAGFGVGATAGTPIEWALGGS